MQVRKRPAKVIAVGINGCERGRVMLLVHAFKDNLLLSKVGLGCNPAPFIHFLPLTHQTKSALPLACARAPKGEDVRSDASPTSAWTVATVPVGSLCISWFSPIEPCVSVCWTYCRHTPKPQTVCAEVNSSGCWCGFGIYFFPLPLTGLLTQRSRQIRADLHTMLKPLASGFFSGALSRVCLVLSDPLGCVDGRLNVRSHEKGQGCLTSHSHAASLINRGPVVLRQSWRWTAPDNCFRTITVFCVCLNVYSLSGMKS